MMNGMGESLRGFFLTIALVVRTTVTNVVGHWALAIFSLVAAGAIWVVIQDIENPRVEDVVPLESVSQGIPIEFVNLSPEFVVDQTPRVRVRVEARQDDIPRLRAADFRATVDLQGVGEGLSELLPVTVESLDDSVTILAVEPARVRVEVARVEHKEVQVQVNITGQLPAGFHEVEAPVIDPPFVTVSGRREIVENVDRVEIDVNLSGQRESFQTTGDLVARNRNGDRQTVTLSATRATVSFHIEQLFVEKELRVRARTTGHPAPGYQLSSIAVQPPTVTVTGRREVIDSLTELTLEPLDLGGATRDITQTRNIQEIPGVSFARDSVRVDIGIAPITCDGSSTITECGAAVYYVAPDLQDVPSGLQLAPAAYTVAVFVSGPLSELGRLQPDAISASASLAGLNEGVSTITPSVTVPSPFRVDHVEPITVTLVSSALP